MRDIKQSSKSEIKANHINKLQQNYNVLFRDYIELKNNYEKLVHFAIETSFSEYNDDVELLLRCLKKQGQVQRIENTYINPLNDENYMKQKSLVEHRKIYDNPELSEKGE